MPDFDIDFCMQGRDRVIDYVAEKYGRDRVSQIITYGTMAAQGGSARCRPRAGMSYGYVDRIAKLIPFELGITLDKALQDEQELKRLYESEEEIRSLIDMARSWKGLTRNAGTHAGGVVIAPSRLTDFTPLFCEEGSHSVVTQFDKDDVRGSRAGEVRLPWPAYAHHHRLDRQGDQCAAPDCERGAARYHLAAHGRSRDLYSAQELPHQCGLSTRVARHEGSHPSPAARPLRRYRRAGRIVSPRSPAIGNGR